MRDEDGELLLRDGRLLEDDMRDEEIDGCGIA